MWRTLIRIPTDLLMLSNLTFLTNQLGLAREKMYGLWGYYHTRSRPSGSVFRLPHSLKGRICLSATR